MNSGEGLRSCLAVDEKGRSVLCHPVLKGSSVSKLTNGAGRRGCSKERRHAKRYQPWNCEKCNWEVTALVFIYGPGRVGNGK